MEISLRLTKQKNSEYKWNCILPARIKKSDGNERVHPVALFASVQGDVCVRRTSGRKLHADKGARGDAGAPSSMNT